MTEYVIIAETTSAAHAFADLNKLRPSKYKIGKTPRSLEGISNLTVIFVEGWRARADHFQMIQLVNEAEIMGVRIIEAKVDQVIDLP